MSDQGTPSLSADGFQTVEESTVDITKTQAVANEDRLTGIVHAVGSVLEPAKAPKLMTMIVIIGFVVIAYSGNMNTLNLLFYILFLVFSGIFYLLLDSVINNTAYPTKLRILYTMVFSLALAASFYLIGRYNLGSNFYYLSLATYLVLFVYLWFKELKGLN